LLKAYVLHLIVPAAVADLHGANSFFVVDDLHRVPDCQIANLNHQTDTKQITALSIAPNIFYGRPSGSFIRAR